MGCTHPSATDSVGSPGQNIWKIRAQVVIRSQYVLTTKIRVKHNYSKWLTQLQKQNTLIEKLGQLITSFKVNVNN